MTMFEELTHAEPPGQLLGAAARRAQPHRCSGSALQRTKQQKKGGLIWSGRCAWQIAAVSERGATSTQTSRGLNAGLSPLTELSLPFLQEFPLPPPTPQYLVIKPCRPLPHRHTLAGIMVSSKHPSAVFIKVSE